MFSFGKDSRIRVYISLVPKRRGGGANTFANNFINWLKDSKDYIFTRNILRANKAIIIANKADIELVKKAKDKGCFIIHRLDEYFEKNESEYRRIKHQKIIELNKYADVTVYQSQFVYNNVHSYLRNNRWAIIVNGADNKLFFPAANAGEYIGHVSWSPDARKRFDILYRLIENYPQEKFLLIGRHKKTDFCFGKFKNVTLVGEVNRRQILRYYHKMKILFLPSEKDPCPNTAVEAILSGVPVCYNPDAGTREIVKDCGVPLDEFEYLLNNTTVFRQRCLLRKDLYFDTVAKKYMML
jgi:hypothetical protein